MALDIEISNAGLFSERRQIRAGVVGGGFMADVHSRSVRSNGGFVVGVASSTPDRARSAARRLGAPRAYESVRELVEDPEIDVVHICTPNSTHAELAALALNAGKHVVCEKPLATSLSDAAGLLSLAKEMGLVASVPFVYRFHPMVREMRARLGTRQLQSFTGSYFQDWMAAPDETNWRVSSATGGPSRAFADIGSHLIDLLEFVSSDRIVGVSARSRTVFAERAGIPVDTEDLGVILVEMASGAVGTLAISQVAAGHKNALNLELSVAGESLGFEQESPDRLWLGRTDGSQLLVRSPESLSPDAARLNVVPSGHPMGYLDAFAGFVGDTYAAIRGEQVEGLPDFASGVRSTVVLDAVLRSAAEQGTRQVLQQ